MTWRNISYWLAVVVSVIFVIVAVIAMFFAIGSYVDWKMHAEQGYAPSLISFFGVLVAAIGAFAGVFFGWRADRRQAKELDLKIKELELKLQNASKK